MPNSPAFRHFRDGECTPEQRKQLAKDLRETAKDVLTSAPAKAGLDIAKEVVKEIIVKRLTNPS